jgi:hypothetical protein
MGLVKSYAKVELEKNNLLLYSFRLTFSGRSATAVTAKRSQPAEDKSDIDCRAYSLEVCKMKRLNTLE